MNRIYNHSRCESGSLTKTPNNINDYSYSLLKDTREGARTRSESSSDSATGWKLAMRSLNIYKKKL